MYSMFVQEYWRLGTTNELRSLGTTDSITVAVLVFGISGCSVVVVGSNPGKVHQIMSGWNLNSVTIESWKLILKTLSKEQ